jgi:hypothetical protein
LWKLFTEPAQLRDIMQAVNSAKGPKFEQDYFSAQFLEGQRAGSVDPFQPGWKFWSVDGSLG